MRLILFDIDGTLIQISAIGRQVVTIALEQVFGTAGPMDGYSFAGKTDRRIIHDLLNAAGVSTAEIENKLPIVFEHMTTIGRSHILHNGLSPCPGILELLAMLKTRPEALLGLQTGNISGTAPLKLAAAGIDPAAFQLGAYGSDTADRTQLPPIAWRRAAALSGETFGGHNTVIVGDTPADIMCAKVNGAMAIAVATGTFSKEALDKIEPDYLLSDLTDTKKAIEILLESK